MKKLSLFSSLIISSKIVFALPTIALPNLVYSPDVQNIGINNIDVRGALINSGKFKVVEAPKNFNLANMNTSEPGKQASNESATSESAPKLANNSPIQDGLSYILIGQVISADTYNNYYQVPNSDSYTGTRTLAVTVSYKLLRTSDKASVAAFNAYATGVQTVILKAGELIHPNQAMILRDASKNLANNVVEQLIGQMDNTTKFEQKDKPVITDIKTYDN